jgi:hypothetical protein
MVQPQYTQIHCSPGPLVYFKVVTLIIKKIMCGEVELVTSMIALHIVGRNVGLMTHKSIIVFLAP